MGKAIAIRAWSRFEFLGSAPTVESHPSETVPSLKQSQATNTFSVSPTDQSPRRTFPLKVNPENEKQVPTKEKERKGKSIHTKVITIERENGGAYIQSQTKSFYSIGNSGSEELNANVKGKNRKVKACTNNNVQRVKNTILFNTSFTRNAL